MTFSLRALAVCASLAGFGPFAHAAVTTYNVVETFNQVVYDSSNPTWDTIFTGSFSFDDATQTVSDLQGTLTQAMSGNTTSRLLSYQLSSVYDASLGGLTVTTFFQDSTDVFAGGGFAPGGKSTYGNQNAYATIFVNTVDPTAALSEAQVDKLAYADCAAGGMMGAVCMTGTSVAGYGSAGTMSGFPLSQVITASVPEPSSALLTLAGLAVGGMVSRRRARLAARS